MRAARRKREVSPQADSGAGVGGGRGAGRPSLKHRDYRRCLVGGSVSFSVSPPRKTRSPAAEARR